MEVATQCIQSLPKWREELLIVASKESVYLVKEMVSGVRVVFASGCVYMIGACVLTHSSEITCTLICIQHVQYNVMYVLKQEYRS